MTLLIALQLVTHPLAVCAATLDPVRRALRVEDVTLYGESGTLYGQLIRSQSPQFRAPQADPTERKPVATDPTLIGVTVQVIRNGKLVQETKTDREGRFQLAAMRGGVNAITVRTSDRLIVHNYRFWQESTAPKSAMTRVDFDLDSQVIRGQYHLKSNKNQEGAIRAMLIGGALAVPIIYGSIRDTSTITPTPASL